MYVYVFGLVFCVQQYESALLCLTSTSPYHPTKRTDIHTHATSIPPCHWHHIQSYLNGSQYGCRHRWYSSLNRDTVLKATSSSSFPTVQSISVLKIKIGLHGGESGHARHLVFETLIQNSPSSWTISPLHRHDFIDWFFFFFCLRVKEEIASCISGQWSTNPVHKTNSKN